MTDYYDYIILSVTNPAFEDNVDLMIQNGLQAGGTSPTITIDKVVLDDSDPDNIIYVTKPIQHPMIGTGEQAGRIMFHFRLPTRLDEVALIEMLETRMTNPKPPISVESITSAKQIIWVDDGLDVDGNPIGHYDYDVLVVATKAAFQSYMNKDEDGNTPTVFSLSKYVGGNTIDFT